MKYVRAVGVGLLVGALVANWISVAAGVIVGIAAAVMACEEEDE